MLSALRARTSLFQHWLHRSTTRLPFDRVVPGSHVLALMLCCEGDVFAIPEPVSVYRKHGANLVKPFAYAHERGLPARQIAAFRVNARLDDAVRTTLLKQWLNNAHWHHDCRARLMAVAPDLVREIEQPALYRATKLALALGRPAFRRRYPLVDSDPSRP